jgi:hypothetical protein
VRPRRPERGSPFIRVESGNASPVGMSPDWIGRNDAAFREANDRIFQSAREYQVAQGIPFLCECADPSCGAIIRLDASEYERVREAGRFFNAPGHSTPFLHAVQVEERCATYEIVVKIGVTAEIEDDLDPRTHA